MNHDGARLLVSAADQPLRVHPGVGELLLGALELLLHLLCLLQEALEVEATSAERFERVVALAHELTCLGCRDREVTGGGSRR